MTCTKKSFDTPEEGQKRANEINKIEQSKKSKVKLRIYRCKKCGKIHLSSMSKWLYKRTKDVQSRNAHRENKFIQREGEYWEKKFNKE